MKRGTLALVADPIGKQLEYDAENRQANALVSAEKLVELLNRIEPVRQLHFLADADKGPAFELAWRNLVDDVEALREFGINNGLFQQANGSMHLATI